jgi:hypothetical protein
MLIHRNSHLNFFCAKGNCHPPRERSQLSCALGFFVPWLVLWTNYLWLPTIDTLCDSRVRVTQ